ncbi:Putative oxidoreductase CatD [Polystyrenella longa]|uniref:Oxidoreductase CatD n=1 Tax=Polystyrenella longa TaxID=2528007 RepID=A0A518CHB3_9PLAN|nr:DoxX family protein [Polystyrenella longa]QDU78611.1 Putative oxidoreductase CatD [Polystyrenella longa]
MNKLFTKLMQTSGGFSVLLIRAMVGLVFLSEGIQKFLYPVTRGAGRFEEISLPMPDFLGYFVGSFEIACGLLIVIGLFVRLAVIPTIIIMLVAISTTKIPMLAEDGFWAMAHAARTDFCMLLGSIFLFLVGAGTLSCDRVLFWKRSREK